MTFNTAKRLLTDIYHYIKIVILQRLVELVMLFAPGPYYVVPYTIIIIIITRDRRMYTGNWNGVMDVRDREIDIVVAAVLQSVE